MTKTPINHRWPRGGIILAILALCLTGQGSLATGVAAEDQSGSSSSESGTVRAEAYALTPFYLVFKLAFAGSGAIVGGLTWAFSAGDREAAQAVWDTSLRGDYWVTPAHLKGERPIRFIGTSEAKDRKQTTTPEQK